MPLTDADFKRIESIVDAKLAAHRQSYIDGAAQRTHEQLNKALSPETGSGSVFRKALMEMTERGVSESLREGHDLDLRLGALVPPVVVPEPPAPAG